MKVDLDELTLKQMFKIWETLKKDLSTHYYLSEHINYAISAVLQHLSFIPIDGLYYLDALSFDMPKGKRIYSKTNVEHGIKYELMLEPNDYCLEISHHKEYDLIEIQYNNIKDIIHTDRLHELEVLPERILSLSRKNLSEEEQTLEFKQTLKDIFKACMGDTWNMLSGIDKLYIQLNTFHETQLHLDKMLKGQ